MIIVVDSGSTKAIWYYSSPSEKGVVRTSGLHPNTLDSFSTADYEQLLPLMGSSGKLFFYGSGCFALTRRAKLEKWLKERFPLFDIEVQSDLIAAGIALYGQNEGIVGIMGTGSSMSVWKNETMTLPIPSLGWALGDEGSGCDIARRFFKEWYSHKFPVQLTTVLENNLVWPNALELIDSVYGSSTGNKYLASFCAEIATLTAHDPVRRIIQHAFHDYFDYYGAVLSANKDLPIAFMGSVAHGFKEILLAVAKARGHNLFSIVENPIKELVTYHMADYSESSSSNV
ncbi:MAG: hypothetical protein PHU27_03830 [Salinivirgaceae bacterium]|nr:hypothetical protein [Salinivirgaceae bacterium]MDD4746068.1 hypothetical protein [Salinivirgaceae bacterium]MDY0281348.1 hypothetical protein [Salinivirgaceae bacterium]